MDQDLKEKYAPLFAEYLGDRPTQKLIVRMERICFKIAPLNTTTGNTQTIFRWELDETNPHYASQEICNSIFAALANDLVGYFGKSGITPRTPIKTANEGVPSVEDIKNVLAHSSRIGSLELPITYKSYDSSPIHSVDNLLWYKTSDKRYLLERWLNNKPIVTKIQVKAFLTDRRQTGEYQTNREVRWEAHPRSPQFATRLDCVEIADKLISQVAIFDNAPEPPSELIPLIEDALQMHYVKNSFRCPISGKHVDYTDFVSKVASPVHGRSGFQVGHMNPLASTGGHVATNISWITDLGNRVQGDSALDDIVKDIFYMAVFHKERLGKDWDEVDAYFN